MTNEKTAKQIARSLAVSDEYPHDYLSAYAGALQAMQWKDEQHAQEKQQLIEKACEFWKHKFPYIDIDIIKEFVDTMKG